MVFIIFFPQVSDSLSLLLYSLHVRLLRASIKINQSIISRHKTENWCEVVSRGAKILSVLVDIDEILYVKTMLRTY